jgi:hypothetical protein
MRWVPPKGRFLQEPHGVTSQKTVFLIGTRPVVACGKETYKINIKDYTTNNYTSNLVVRSFGMSHSISSQRASGASYG